MKKINISTAIIGSMLFATSVFADKTPIDSSRPISQFRKISIPSTFVVDNEVGKIQIYESTGQTLDIQAQYTGSSQAHLVFEEPDRGKVKIAIEYSNSGSLGSGNVQFRENGFSISNIFSGGSIVINGGGSVIVNGQRISPNAKGAVIINGSGSGEVTLRIGIPSQMLVHLKATTSAGVIAVKGIFRNGMEAQRQVSLKAQSGDISCQGICSLGELSAKSQSGNIEAIGLKGNISLKTMSGNIIAENNEGAIRAESMSGDVRVNGHQEGSVYAKTMSGDVNLNNPNRNVIEEASSISGRVRGLRSTGGDGESCKNIFSNKGGGPFDF